ncbi:hypothetical protein HPB47_003779 [Ixodes persulcatus]|uniref:Uncharacterized protein n=1 Tax=Ixodes persulcatus TaxID=34615 RepID=A0AC60PII6_IXOPE|nr:hypothetical protein HPB47_003779 [Ixodes persulcatus]
MTAVPATSSDSEHLRAQLNARFYAAEERSIQQRWPLMRILELDKHLGLQLSGKCAQVVYHHAPRGEHTDNVGDLEDGSQRDLRKPQHAQRFQLSSEPPEQYFYDVLQLCSRVNENMTEEEKLRQLTRGLRPEVLERVVLTNPQTTAEFLTTLQRLTQASQMAQHNMWTMPTHPLPGFNSPAPQQASQTTRSSQSPSDFQRAALPMTTAPGFYQQPGTSSSLPEVTSLPQLHSELYALRRDIASDGRKGGSRVREMSERALTGASKKGGGLRPEP